MPTLLNFVGTATLLAFVCAASVHMPRTADQQFHCAADDTVPTPLCYERNSASEQLFFCDYAYGPRAGACPGQPGNPENRTFICAYNKATGVVAAANSSDYQGAGASPDEFCPASIQGAPTTNGSSSSIL